MFKNIIQVGHPYGCFHCLRLAELYPKIFEKLFLIDPIVKNESYYNYLLSKYKDLVEEAEIQILLFESISILMIQ